MKDIAKMMFEEKIQGNMYVLIGAIIHQAKIDYKSKDLKKRFPMIWKDAKDFLFKGERLEKLLYKYGLTGQLNCDLIRKEAKAFKERDMKHV